MDNEKERTDNKKESTNNKKERTDNNNNNLKAILISIGIFALSIVLLLIGSFIIPFVASKHFAVMLTMQVLSIVNIALLLFLLHTYVRSYLEIKSNFTLGIVLFISTLLLFVLATNKLIIGFLGIGIRLGAVMDIIPLAFSAISLAILSYLSNK